MSQHFLVLGYGVTGKAILRYLIYKYPSSKAKITIFDQQTDFASDAYLQELIQSYPQFDFNFISDVADITNLHIKDTIDFCIVSPGIKPKTYQTLLVEHLRIPVFSDIQIFIDELAYLTNSDSEAKVFAITGTNGKSTVSALLHCLLSTKHNAVLGGNFGLAAPDLLTNPDIEKNTNPTDYIIELSSYQLELTHHLPCMAATCLNLSPNHLDWHGDFDHYIAAKMKIFDQSNSDIINIDDPLVYEQYKNNILKFKIQKGKLPRIVLYTMDSAENLASKVKELISLQQNLIIDTLNIKATVDNQFDIMFNGTKITNTVNLPLVLHTKHNISNLLAVLGLLMAKFDNRDLQQQLNYLKEYLLQINSFTGLPFRCQKISTNEQIAVFNDSKSTNLTATIKAMDSVASLTPGNIILIMGGILKEDIDDQLIRQAFIKCIDQYKTKISCVLILSKDPGSKQKLIDLIEETNRAIASNIKIVTSDDLLATLSNAYEHAQSGDSILFSPAGASFDLFKNYIDRGEKFTAAWTKL